MNKMKIKVFVADDDESIFEAVCLVLEDEGYEVLTSNDAETVQAVGRTKPDLVLLDIWMAGIDGSSVCKELKAQQRTRSIPVIMVSANKDTEQIAHESGAEDYIAKPFEIDELLAKVKKYTSR